MDIVADSVRSVGADRCNPATRLGSRVLKAEVAVVLPRLEEQRRDLLSRFTPLLRLPFTTRFGESITNPFDLEIAHIATQLRHPRSGLDTKTRRRLQRMADVRNKLAHMELLDLEDLEVMD